MQVPRGFQRSKELLDTPRAVPYVWFWTSQVCHKLLHTHTHTASLLFPHLLRSPKSSLSGLQIYPCCVRGSVTTETTQATKPPTPQPPPAAATTITITTTTASNNHNHNRGTTSNQPRGNMPAVFEPALSTGSWCAQSDSAMRCSACTWAYPNRGVIDARGEAAKEDTFRELEVELVLYVWYGMVRYGMEWGGMYCNVMLCIIYIYMYIHISS